MNFGDAIAELKRGGRVTRAGWNGIGMYLVLINQYDYSVISSPANGYQRSPFIAMKTANQTIVPWLASQTDMLAEDWMVTYNS